MDRLEAMSIFLAVVEAGSLSAAARRLKAPLATISRKISELEAHLNTKLFNRSSRKLVLTEAGSSYVAACKRILIDVMEADARGLDGIRRYQAEHGTTSFLATTITSRMPELLDAVAKSRVPCMSRRGTRTSSMCASIRSKARSSSAAVRAGPGF